MICLGVSELNIDNKNNRIIDKCLADLLLAKKGINVDNFTHYLNCYFLDILFTGFP